MWAILARVIACCPEPRSGSALHRSPLKNKTNPAFRGFALRLGEWRYSGPWNGLMVCLQLKTCRKALVWVTSSIQQCKLPCIPREGCAAASVQAGTMLLSGASSVWRPGLGLSHTPAFSYFLFCSHNNCTACSISLYAHHPSLSSLSLSFAGQGEKGDTGMKVGMRNTVF